MIVRAHLASFYQAKPPFISLRTSFMEEPTSTATITFRRVEDLQDLPCHFLVFPRHLLCFPGQVGKDVMEAAEVQVELGF